MISGMNMSQSSRDTGVAMLGMKHEGEIMPRQIMNGRLAITSIINISILLLSLSAFSVLVQGQQASEVQALAPNQPLERALKGGEAHSYRVTLKAGEYFHVDVEQRGIDVTLLIVDAGGKTLVERDRPNEVSGQESLSFIAAAGGEHRLDVKALEEEAEAGEYEIKSELARTPTAQDKKRIEAENLFQEGLRLGQGNTIESVARACEKYEAAAALWRDIGDAYAEALTRTSLGDGMVDLDEHEKAGTAYGRALLLYRELNNRGDEADSLRRLSVLNAVLQKPDPALTQYRQAKEIYRDLKDAGGEKNLNEQFSKVSGDYLDNGFKLFQQGGEEALRNALRLYSIAREMYRELEDSGNEALAVVSLGRIHDGLGERPKALAYYNQALPLFRKAKNQKGEATALHNIGLVYSDLGNLQQALDYYENKALPLFREAEDIRGEATTLNSLGGVYSKLDDRQKALAYYEQALPLRRRAGDKSGEATTLNNIGDLYFDLEEQETALDYYENKALPLFREAKNKRGEAATLNNIGHVYSELGNLQKALDYYGDKALPLFRAAGDRKGEASALNNLGSVYLKLGEKQKALDYYTQALPLRRGVGDKSDEALTLNNIGRAHYDLGDLRKALDYYENQALPLFREARDKMGEATALSNTGGVYSDLEEQVEALEYYKQALPLFREAGNKSGEAMALNNIGHVYSELGNLQKALDYYENQALPLFIRVKDKRGEATTLNNMMFAWATLKNPRAAVFYGKKSVNVLQQLRGRNQDLENEFQRSLLKSVEGFYRYLAILLIGQGRLAEAVQVLNAFKDQQYFDFNNDALKKPVPLAFTPREAGFDSQAAVATDKISSIGKNLDTLKLTAGGPTPNPEEAAKLQRLESDLKTAIDAYLATLKQAETEFSRPPDTVKDHLLHVKDTREIHEALGRLGQKTIVVYTLAGVDRFRALIVTSDDVMVVSSPIRSDELNNKARQLWGLLQSDEYDPKLLSKEVYGLVFKPIKDKLIAENKLEKVLPEGATIMWSLDSNLRYLPMAALYDGEKYLVERYNNVVFTRAEAANWTRDPLPNWTGVGFGNSRGGNIEYLKLVYPFNDLPNVTEELNAVFKTDKSRSGIFDGDIYSDSMFTLDAMIAALKKHRPLVHISSHFKFAPGDEAGSFLLLGNGTVFPLNEMKARTDLFEGVELLTLSACETAAQWADSDGREVDGFAELAQRLGASAVMATLWRVRDDSSYWLMREFYERKQKTKRTKAESLRQAQIALLNGTAQVTPVTQPGKTNTKKRSGNSMAIKILPAGKEFPANAEDGVVYVEARYVKPYDPSGSSRYAHPFYWSPFILFGNWR